MKHLKAALYLASATVLLSAPAQAQSSMNDRISALEATIAQLKAELDAQSEQSAQTDADIIQLQEKVAAPTPVAVKASGGTNFKVSGFIDFDAHVTNLSEGGPFGSNSIARDFFIPSVTPTGDGTGDNGSTVTDFTAQSSRVRIHGDRSYNDKKITGLVELDFLGSMQGNQRVSSSFSPRLRRAFVDYNGLRIGQEWTTFQNLSSIPESASFLALSDGMVFNRQALIRYTTGPFQIAAENGNATITPDSGSGRIEADGNTLPDIIARYNMKGDYGNVSIAGIGRQLRLASTEEEAFGFGASLSGRIKAGGGDVRFGLTGGEGLGRYIGLNALNAAAVNPANGEVEAIPSYGGHIAYRHPFGETARLNLGYSGLFADNPEFLTTLNPGATKSVQSGYAAVLWDVAPKITMGVEGLLGTKELENGNDGDITRFTFSTKYNF